MSPSLDITTSFCKISGGGRLKSNAPPELHLCYYHAHKQLRHFWLNSNGVFAELSPADQWLLHDYYQPNQAWSKPQLLQHLVDITKRRPGLTQQAGRAYAQFQNAAAVHGVQVARAQPAMKAPASRTRRGERVISIKAVVKPEPDVRMFVRALLAMARHEQERKHDDVA